MSQEKSSSTPSKTVDPEVLPILQERGGSWAAYENQAMDSGLHGHLQFLQVGPGRTHETAPEQLPDGPYGPGWKYRYVGTVDLVTGAVQ